MATSREGVTSDSIGIEAIGAFSNSDIRAYEPNPARSSARRGVRAAASTVFGRASLQSFGNALGHVANEELAHNKLLTGCYQVIARLDPSLESTGVASAWGAH